MTDTPLVSVLMTVYNREKYLDQAISSVLASRYSFLELIIVDDCSTDKSRDVILKYVNSDDRIRFYQNERNLGDYNNRNHAATFARGKYIKYLDADDMMYPWCLDVWVEQMEQYPEAAFSLESVINDTESPLPELLSPYAAYYKNFFKFHFLHKAPTSSLIKTEIFRKYGGFSGKRMVGDFEFWLKLVTYENILIVPNGLTWYRHHSEQESRLIREGSLFNFDYIGLKIDAVNNPDCPLDVKERLMVVRYMRKLQGRSILRSFLIERRFDDAFEKMRRSGISLIRALFYSFSNNKMPVDV